ncbi:MAG TPA: preprotein translocase subunit SecY [Terriglobales bacterium]|nr:preprotein translocase subunit SecY [Terriglobales bacterium]
MIETIRNAWKVADLRKRILFTLMIIVLFRFGSKVPVPFLDASVLQAYIAANSGTIFGYIDMLSGGAFSQATLFAMSISPYINASIIVQLLTVGIPALEKLAKEGEEGRKKLTRYTRVLTVVLGMIQGYGMYAVLRKSGAVKFDSWFVACVIIASFAAGTALLMWLAEQVNTNGIGNGISIILFSGIVARLPATLAGVSQNLKLGTIHLWLVALIAIVAVGLIALVVVVTNAERRVPVQYAKRVVGRKVYGGQASHIPIKVNGTGVLPVIFAQSFLSIPATIASFFPAPAEGSFMESFLNALQYTSPVYACFYALFIIGFSFFYISMTYNPVEIANNLKKNGGFIPGIRPGRPTSDFIAKILGKITFFGSFFLVFIAVLPILCSIFLPVNVSLGGTTIIILVGVALETVKQMESMMLMRHYKGFLE